MPKTLVARIQFLLEHSSTASREKLSRACGLSRSHIGLILNGHIETIGPDVAQKISVAADCSVLWLLYGDRPEPNVARVRAALTKAVAVVDAKSRRGKSPSPKAA